MTTFILGAGPAGLAIADGITESNLDDMSKEVEADRR